MPTKTPAPPKGSTPEARALWNNTHAVYELDAIGLVHLRRACEALDRIAEARADIAANGLSFVDRYGQPRPTPAVAIEHQAAARLRASLAALDLPDLPEEGAVDPARAAWDAMTPREKHAHRNRGGKVPAGVDR